MGYFAELSNDDTVTRVVVADSDEWCARHLEGRWVETKLEDPVERYAGIGMKLRRSHAQRFEQPRPFASWSVDARLEWTAPVPKPDGDYRWNDQTSSWVAVRPRGD